MPGLYSDRCISTISNETGICDADLDRAILIYISNG